MAKLKDMDLPIEGMHCASCVLLTNKTLDKVDGIEKVEADLASNKVHLTVNPKKVSLNQIENEVKKLTENRGADGVIECAGVKETFEMSWKIARPNAIVGVVAMYEEPLSLPLPDMYGKNLTFKTGGVDAIHCQKLVKLIEEKKISTDFLITQKFKLENIIEAYRYFNGKPQGCLKIAITP